MLSEKRGRFVSRWWRDAGAIAAVMRENDRLVGVGFGAPEAIQDSCKQPQNRSRGRVFSRFLFAIQLGTLRHVARFVCFSSLGFSTVAQPFSTRLPPAQSSRGRPRLSRFGRVRASGRRRGTHPRRRPALAKSTLFALRRTARRLLERRNSRRLFPGARTRIAHARRGPAENPDARDGQSPSTPSTRTSRTCSTRSEARSWRRPGRSRPTSRRTRGSTPSTRSSCATSATRRASGRSPSPSTARFSRSATTPRCAPRPTRGPPRLRRARRAAPSRARREAPA